MSRVFFIIWLKSFKVYEKYELWMLCTCFELIIANINQLPLHVNLSPINTLEASWTWFLDFLIIWFLDLSLMLWLLGYDNTWYFDGFEPFLFLKIVHSIVSFDIGFASFILPCCSWSMLFSFVVATLLSSLCYHQNTSCFYNLPLFDDDKLKIEEGLV